jgi:hypothetical protein
VKFDSRSTDTFGEVGVVVDNAGIPRVAPPTTWHNDRAAAMLAFVAGLLVAAIGARPAEEPTDPGRPPSEPARTVSACRRLLSSWRRPISPTSAPGA